MGAVLAMGCGPSAQVQEVPPGHLEYDLVLERIYRGGARVEHLPVPEEIDAVGGGAIPPESLEACYFLNSEGLAKIEDTIASLDPSAEYPLAQCDDPGPDTVGTARLYLEGFAHSPFDCPSVGCGCNENLVPIANVYAVVKYNLEGIAPMNEDGDELWYLDTMRSCVPGEWREEGS